MNRASRSPLFSLLLSLWVIFAMPSLAAIETNPGPIHRVPVASEPDMAFLSARQEKQLGESTYTNPLPPSTLAALAVRTHVAQPRLLGLLRDSHDQRMTRSPRWRLMLDEIHAVEQASSHGSASLNFADRKAERDADMAAAKVVQDRRRRSTFLLVLLARFTG